MPGLLRVLGAAALVAAIASCGSVRVEENVDAHVDALLQLPDAMGPPDKCKGSVAPEDFGSCVGLALCKLLPACGFGQAGDLDCSDLPLELFNGVSARIFADVVASSTTAGRSTYDPVAAAACVASLQTLSCKAIFGNGGSPFEGCATFVGKVAVGAPCAYPFECAAGAVCASTSGNQYDSTCGADVCKGRVAVNQACATAPCQVGDHCVSGTCTHGDLNAKCTSDNDCDPDLSCGTGGVCVAAGAPGVACTRDRECSGSLLCVGDSLTPAAGLCRDVSAKGATCDDRCNGPYLCSVPGANMLGTCVDEPAEGAPCVPGGRCGVLLMVCDDKGTPTDPTDDLCRTPGDLGAVCTSSGNTCNLGLFCSADVSGAATGVCSGPLPDNTSCTKDDQCASSNCVNQFCKPFPACSV